MKPSEYIKEEGSYITSCDCDICEKEKEKLDKKFIDREEFEKMIDEFVISRLSNPNMKRTFDSGNGYIFVLRQHIEEIKQKLKEQK